MVNNSFTFIPFNFFFIPHLSVSSQSRTGF
jgi:hypothetical protein